MLGFRRPPMIDRGPELAELRSRVADLERENARLEDVADRRREAVERLAGERDKALDQLNECRKAVIDLEARLATAVEGRDARDVEIVEIAEHAGHLATLAGAAVRKFGSKRQTN